MATTQAATIKQSSKFMVWYNSPQGQRLVGATYSLGASVVILGALFKIMHWPAAGYILTAGMITEAILFGIGVFEKPHKSYHWENIYPALVGENVEPVSLGSAMPSASLSLEESKKLESGIKQLSETAGQLGDISKAAATSTVFAKNLTDASEAAASFASKQRNLDTASDGLFQSYKEIAGTLATVSAGTKTYAEKTSTLQNSMSAINSIYELELKNIEAQAQAIKSQSDAINAQSAAIGTQTSKVTAATSDLDKLFATVVATAKDMEAYKQQTEKLAKQVSDLNNVYGNMLNAIRS
ncbi:MAG: gliding motility protein GldL [Prevotellaceae bacterium]|jgi:gliding motility-associated protein GldL|nr:gliding motility protein GldL [Prevotellaceae bacterium]